MIDGIRALPPSYAQERILGQLEFTSILNELTGEIYPKKIAKERHLRISFWPPNYMEILGSIHKFYCESNDGDFDIDCLTKAIEELATRYSFNPSDCYLSNLEVAVNIELPIEVGELLDSLVQYKHKAFSTLSPSSEIELGKICNLSQYSIKLYNKGPNSNAFQSRNLLRYEIKVRRMQWLGWKERITLSTLLQNDFLLHLQQLLLKAWDQINLIDDRLASLVKTDEHRAILETWCNIRKLNQLKRSDSEEYNLQYRKYRRISKRYSEESCLKLQIRNLIEQKWDQLQKGV